MDINFELYKVFYYVATTLSFSEAANHLYISQSAVSQSIKTLEKKLNRTLFIRNTKKVSLTPEGELLLRHVEPAMNLIHQGEIRLNDIEENGGHLRIGASDTICRYFLVPFIEKFHQAFPGVHIKVTNATSIRCVELLNNGQVYFIVANAPNAYLGNLYTTRKVKEFQDVFIANDSYAHLKDRPVTLKELLNHPILMLDQKSTTSEFLHYFFQQHQLDLIPEAELSSNDLLIDLAGIGLGIACVPKYCILEEPKGLFIVETTEKLPHRELVAAYNPKLPLSRSAEAFLNYFDKDPSQNS